MGSTATGCTPGSAKAKWTAVVPAPSGARNAKVLDELMATLRPSAGGDHMPDGRLSGSDPVQVHDLRPPEIPRQRDGADGKASSPRKPAHLVLAQDRSDQALGLLEHLHALAIARADRRL